MQPLNTDILPRRGSQVRPSHSRFRHLPGLLLSGLGLDCATPTGSLAGISHFVYRDSPIRLPLRRPAPNLRWAAARLQSRHQATCYWAWRHHTDIDPEALRYIPYHARLWLVCRGCPPLSRTNGAVKSERLQTGSLRFAVRHNRAIWQHLVPLSPAVAASGLNATPPLSRRAHSGPGPTDAGAAPAHLLVEYSAVSHTVLRRRIGCLTGGSFH